jgi:hypothetical protein
MASLASRRSLLASLATLPAITSRTASTLASPADAALFAALARFHDANRAVDLACAAEDEAMSRYEAPDFPDALWVRDKDPGLVVPVGYSGGGGQRRYFQDVTIEYLRKLPCERRIRHERPATAEGGFTEAELAEGQVIVRYERQPWPEAQARADEIVTAFDAWQSEKQRRRDASGLTTALSAVDGARRAYRKARDELIRIPARTMEGVIAKAACVIESFYADEDGQEQLAEDVEGAFAGLGISLTLARDLYRLTRVA